jgi:peptidoglycan hydrolase-like protein with peptidoglycan-binding domain
MFSSATKTTSHSWTKLCTTRYTTADDDESRSTSNNRRRRRRRTKALLCSTASSLNSQQNIEHRAKKVVDRVIDRQQNNMNNINNKVGVLFSANKDNKNSEYHNDYSKALDKLRASGCECYDVGSRFLSKGDQGEDVKALQALLMADNVLSKKVEPTGFFDDATKVALMTWQTKRNLPEHGAFGDLCRLAYLDEKRLEQKLLLSSPLPPDRQKWKQATRYQSQAIKVVHAGKLYHTNSNWLSMSQMIVASMIGAAFLAAAFVLPNIDQDELVNRPEELTKEEEERAMRYLGKPTKNVQKKSSDDDEDDDVKSTA